MLDLLGTPRIIHLQPALPHYRVDFFSRLAAHYGGQLEVFYSPIDMGALTSARALPEWAKRLGPFRHVPGGFMWQPGAADLPISKGDVVVLSGNPRQLSTLLLMERARRCGARTIWWGHYRSSTSKPWRHALRHLPMARAGALLFYTDNEVSEYRATAAGQADRREVRALNNGLNLDPIAALRSPYDVGGRDHALLFIGRLTIKADLGLGLKALAALGERAPHLHVVGEGPEEMTLKAHAMALGIRNKITWYGAITEETQIARVANRCRAFLYPGEVGLSLIHAMGYGLPAIIHDMPRLHMPEVAAFSAGQSGAAFRFRDVDNLAEVIERMLADDASLQRWSAYARATVDRSYNTADMARRFIALTSALE